MQSLFAIVKFVFMLLFSLLFFMRWWFSWLINFVAHSHSLSGFSVHSLYPSKVSNHKRRSIQRCDWFWIISRRMPSHLCQSEFILFVSECIFIFILLFILALSVFTGLGHANKLFFISHSFEVIDQFCGWPNLCTYCRLFICFCTLHLSVDWCARTHSMR